jgi:hypothetical protein
VAEQSGSGEVVPAAPSPDDVRVFRESLQTIARVITAIQNADQMPSTLEAEEPLERNGTDNEALEPAMVTRAENLYAIAVRCLKMVRRIAGYLRTLGWTKEQEEIFGRAFDALADGWSTYQVVLGDLGHIGWDDETPRDRVLAGLERPRRKYINLLDAYQVQLLVVLDYLDPATDVTAGE